MPSTLARRTFRISQIWRIPRRRDWHGGPRDREGTELDTGLREYRQLAVMGGMALPALAVLAMPAPVAAQGRLKRNTP